MSEIPEDLREMYENGGDPAHEPLSPYSYICRLIERIAQAEAKVAALEAELAEEERADKEVQEIVGKYQADIAALEAENGRLKEALTLCEHKIEQHLQGQYPDGAALRAALGFARAQQPSPQDKPPDSLKQELLKEIMADPGNQLFGIPLSEVQRIITAHRAPQDKEQG